MTRIDWHLFRPPRQEGEETQDLVDTVLRCLQDTNRFGESRETDEALAKVEERYRALTVSPCEAASAPVVADDPDWETRAVDEFAESDTDLELEEYLELRRVEPDCERCPYASPYSLYPMAPCEFSAGGLSEVLEGPELSARASEIMIPDDMITYAQILENAVAAGRLRDHEGVNSEDYVAKAILFLRFWAKLGFTIVPIRWTETEVIEEPQTVSEANESNRMLH